jgi:tRNA(Ile)-lysidine synthase TilS/MesJ
MGAVAAAAAADAEDVDVDADAGVGAGAAGVGEAAIESVARIARYRLLFDEMLQRRVHVLATGHHADDQIETVLMRLGSGSTALGLGGMRPVRRFGMAMGRNEGDFGWFGHEGLERWIVRPLLDVPKVRISRAPLPFSFTEFSCSTRAWCVCGFFLGQNSRDLRLA